MRVIHAGGFSKQERKNWRSVIFNNLVNAFQIILGAMEEQRTEFEDENNMQWAQYVGADPEISPDEPLPPDSLHAFLDLWHDKGVQMAMLKGNEYALHDNLE
jgi:guanine nucleotide-binding protein subunit alpha